jgi:hypothetical protein
LPFRRAKTARQELFDLARNFWLSSDVDIQITNKQNFKKLKNLIQILINPINTAPQMLGAHRIAGFSQVF